MVYRRQTSLQENLTRTYSRLSDSKSRSRSRTRSNSYISRGRSRSSRANSFINFLSSNGSYLYPRKSESGNLLSLFSLLKLELNLPLSSDVPNEKDPLEKDAQNAIERVISLVRVPIYLEKFMLFGLLVCLNSLLTIFSLVPLKVLIISYHGMSELFKDYQRTSVLLPGILGRKLLWVRKDIITMAVLSLSLLLLFLPGLDISRMYHDVRGQAHIKLYVMFGVLEVAEKLCSSIGQDMLSILYNIPINSQIDFTNNGLKFISFFILSVLYLTSHAYILIYQTVSLNVAANSYSNALLTLLLSNQFAELKSSVFKKFEREGLFQISMADLTERFQLSLMLTIISIRNLLQLNSTYLGMIPNSWKSWNTWIGALFGPIMVVIGSEIFVDWLKHCYISKFNRIRPRVYHKFLHVLSLDFLQIFRSTPNPAANLLSELTDYIVLTKRIGLPLLATIVCFLRMTLPDFKQLLFTPLSGPFYSYTVTLSLAVICFFILLYVRLILGLVILKWAANIEREINDTNEAQPQETDSVPKQQSRMLDGNSISSEGELSPTMKPLLSMQSQKISSGISPELKGVSDEKVPPLSPLSPIALSFLPGIPNSESSSINPTTRSYLYDKNELVPPTVEERRNKQILRTQDTNNELNEDEGLGKVMRYEMSSKRIW